MVCLILMGVLLPMKTKDLKYILEMFAVINKIQPLRPITSFVEMFCANGVFRIGTTD